MAGSGNLIAELGRLSPASPDAGRPGASSVKGHPKLHIVAGEALSALTAQVRASLPPSKYLLHIHPPGGAEALRASRPPGERTLFLETGDDAHLLGSLSGFLRTLRPDACGLTVQDTKNPAIADAIPKIRMALDLELPNLKVDRMSGLGRLRCSLLNLAGIAKPRKLSAKAVDPKRPALVVGAGPSLSGQLDFIAANKERFLIVACGHAAIRMKERGLEPDFAVEADPRCRINWSRFAGSLSCPLAALSCADPEVCERFERVVWLNGDCEEFKALCLTLGLALPNVAISRGVIVTALDFAFKLGCEEAALAGCDLALSSDGATHAGSRRAEGDELSLLEAEGMKPGERIVTTLDFDKIRKALERHIELSKLRGKVFNCTPSGARIAGIEHLPLERFLEGREGPFAPEKLELVETEAPAPTHLKNAATHFGKYAVCARRSAACARKVAAALSGRSVDQALLLKERGAFNEALREEAGRFKASGMERILAIAKNKAEDCVDETPGSNLPENDATGQLELFARKKELTASFCEELKGDLERSVEALDGKAPPPRDPAEFKSFLEVNCAAIAKANPELAQAILSRSLPSPESAGFSLHLRFEDIPQAARVLPDGSRHPFNGLLSGEQEARRLVEAFAKSFDPAREAALIAAPGNYAIVEAFSSRFPESPCLILEPWPELLAELCRRSLFLHRLPEGSAAIAPDERFKRWREALSNAVLKLEGAGRRLRPLLNPKTASLPEAKAVMELKELA